jgi:hypothetical protein
MVSNDLLIISANPLVSTIDLPLLPSPPSSPTLIPIGELAFEINNGHLCCLVHAQTSRKYYLRSLYLHLIPTVRNNELCEALIHSLLHTSCRRN